jgi:hypothetical protein
MIILLSLEAIRKFCISMSDVNFDTECLATVGQWKSGVIVQSDLIRVLYAEGEDYRYIQLHLTIRQTNRNTFLYLLARRVVPWNCSSYL